MSNEMELNIPDMGFTAEPTQPTVYPVDATQCRDIKEMGMLMNALGLAMTKEYAEANGLMHLLKIEE